MWFLSGTWLIKQAYGTVTRCIYEWRMLRYFKKVEENPSQSGLPGLTLEEKQRASEEVRRITEKNSEKRGKYNDYTPELRAKIGKYAAECGPTRASRHFTKELGKDVPESTARRLKKAYVEKHKILTKRSDKNPQVTVLPKQSQRRPLLVGQQLDKSIQTESLRKAGGVVNTAIVVSAAYGIISVREPSLLREHGGHLELTKSWAKSLLKCMGYVKRKGSNAGKVAVARFEELKEEYLADIKAVML